MSTQGVIFDMDGVLVNSYRAHLESWTELGRRHGLAMSEEQFATTFGRTSRDIFAALWPGKVAETDIPRLDDEKEALYREILKAHFPEMEGAGDLLASLHAAGFLMAIGSSGPPENVQVVHDCLPNGRFITATVNGRQVKHGKPNPEVFLLAAAKLGLNPRDCAVVEDAPAGVEAARRAGMAAIAITGTAPREKLSHAHTIIDSLTELTPGRVGQLIDHNRTHSH
jgi:beta-phosphoglucomutase